MTQLRWVLYRGNGRVLQWRDSDGRWHDVHEIDYQQAQREDQEAKEDKADRERMARNHD